MGQKVNPISLRLEKTNRHFDSCWYDDYNYTDLLLQDLKIKNYFKTVLNQIAYPEGRILIENLPKKSNINLFYCNPSNSRRKKKIRFQLQDYKDNKKSRKDKKPFGKSFFSFPEQKYWNQEKNDTFTLAQQTLEGWKKTLTAPLHLYKKNVQLDPFSFPKVEKGRDQEGAEFLQSRKVLYSLSDLYREKKTVIDTEKGWKHSKKIIAERRLSPKGDQLGYSVLPKKKAKDNKGQVDKKTKEYSKIKKIIESNILRPFDKQALLLNPSVDKDLVVMGNPFSYKQAHPLPLPKSFTGGTSGMGDNNINNFLLQFVLKNSLFYYNKSVEKQDTEKWVVERFFVRYLLAQLYGKFLQNKSVSSQENLRTLYQFKIFFQGKKKKQKPIREYRDSKKEIRAKYPSLLPKQDGTKKVQKEPNSQKGITKVNTFSPLKRERREKVTRQKDATLLKSKILKNRVLSGLYSSNRVYKSHLESFLSKQYNSFFNLHLFRTLIEKQGALFLVQEIIYYLERKMPFRRIKTQILREIPHYKHIKGVRITCSGRVGGRSKKAQRSKTQSVKIGQTPLGVFSSKIDFASKSALTRFGLIGVKVWVCYQ